MRQVVGQLMRNLENWVLFVLAVGTVVLFFNTFGYRFSAALFPRIVTSVIALLCVWALVANTRRVIAGNIVKKEKSQEASHGLKWYWTVLVMGLYFVMIYFVGFIWSTGVFLFLFPVVAGYRRWILVLIVAVVTAIFIEVSISTLLQIQLPVGVLFK